MKLRDYQKDIIEKTRAHMRSGTRAIQIQAPTGSGKTLLTAFMLKTAASKGMRSWFVVHRRELIKQSVLAFSQVGVRHGVISSGHIPEPHWNIQICSVRTLANRLNKINNPKLIVWDESHHIAANTWKKIYLKYPNAFHIGLSATPCRTDGTGLDRFFDEMVEGPSVRELIDKGNLSDYKIYAPNKPDLSGVKKRGGDFIKSALAEEVDKKTITGNAIREYKKRANGKRAVVFAVSVEHSKHIVEQFKTERIRAEHIDGTTDRNERDLKIQLFQRGKIKVLSNVDLFGEGFDVPGIECVILLRPTDSLGLYLQQVGRSLRPAPGKERAIILDHAGNVFNHGLPDDDREWSLKGVKKNSESELKVKECPRCFAVIAVHKKSCPECGHEFKSEAKPREINEIEGELGEVDTEQIRREKKREQGRARTYDELVQLGYKRGYKNPEKWAWFVNRHRQRKKMGLK